MNASDAPAPRTVVLYDGDCGFCIWTVHVMLRLDRDHRLRAEAIQDRRDLLPGMGDDRALASFHLVAPDGRVRSAGDALAVLVGMLPAVAPFARLLARFPKLTERGYRLVADHRGSLARAVPERAKANARLAVTR